MGFDYELKYIPGEKIPHADALSRMDFDKDESDNDQVCFAINNIYFAQRDLVTQSEIKTEIGKNRLFQDIIKRIKSGNWKQFLEAEKGFEQHKDHLTYTMESFSEVLFLSFHPNYDAWFCKSKRDTTWEECN